MDIKKTKPRILLGLTLFLGLSMAGAQTADEEPPASAGLELWLKADAITGAAEGAPVEVWPDSGPKKHAVRMTSGHKAPVFGKDSVNGRKPGVRFNGRDTLLDLPGLRIGHNTTVFIVCQDRKQTSGGSSFRPVLAAQCDPYDLQKGNGYGIGYMRDGRDGFAVCLRGEHDMGQVKSIRPPAGGMEIVSFRKSGHEAVLYRNGLKIAPGGMLRDQSRTYPSGYTLGGMQGSRFYTGVIAEALVYNRALSETEQKRVEDYLSRKYRIPLQTPPADDPRYNENGVVILRNGYADQPYVARLKDGSWLCVITTSATTERGEDRTLVLCRSRDNGRTWSDPEAVIEPDEAPQPSWGTLFVAPFGRVYAFYNISKPFAPGYMFSYCYKYSDDNGKTWSDRYILQQRKTIIDQADIRVGAWGVNEPFAMNGVVYVSFSRFRKTKEMYGEGSLFASDNLLTERDPDKLRWEMLPRGDRGIRSDKLGCLQQEHTAVPLPEGGMYCTFRTMTGYIGHAYSRDSGKTWPVTEFATYTPGGRRIKQPRACCRIFRCENGQYLLWYHNNDGRRTPMRNRDRNPAWVAGGVLKDGLMHWSQPEILLYGFGFPHDHGMSYPDLIEEDGRYWVTETQKQIARIHEIDASLLEGMWSQFENRTVPTKGLLLNSADDPVSPQTRALEKLPSAGGEGFTIDLAVTFENLDSGQVLLDSRSPKRGGLSVTTTDRETVQLTLDDGRNAPHSWDCDSGLLMPGRRHQLTFIVNGGPRIVSALVDGRLCDGGEDRQFGWSFFNPSLGDVSGNGNLRMAPQLNGTLHALRIYDRPLRTSEAVGLWNGSRSKKFDDKPCQGGIRFFRNVEKAFMHESAHRRSSRAGAINRPLLSMAGRASFQFEIGDN